MNIFYGLRESIRLLEEGLSNVFARHSRPAEATRRAVQVWAGNAAAALLPNLSRYSDSVTAVLMPDGCLTCPQHGAESVQRLARWRPGRAGGKIFRIGHLGDLNEPMLLGADRSRDGAADERHPARQGRRGRGDGLPGWRDPSAREPISPVDGFRCALPILRRRPVDGLSAAKRSNHRRPVTSSREPA